MAHAGSAPPLFAYNDIPPPSPTSTELPLSLTTSSESTTPAADSPRSPSGTPAIDPASELQVATPARRRRADELEDLEQHADWAARRVRLKPSGMQELKRIAQVREMFPARSSFAIDVIM